MATIWYLVESVDYLNLPLSNLLNVSKRCTLNRTAAKWKGSIKPTRQRLQDVDSGSQDGGKCSETGDPSQSNIVETSSKTRKWQEEQSILWVNQAFKNIQRLILENVIWLNNMIRKLFFKDVHNLCSHLEQHRFLSNIRAQITNLQEEREYLCDVNSIGKRLCSPHSSTSPHSQNAIWSNKMFTEFFNVWPNHCPMEMEIKFANRHWVII